MTAPRKLIAAVLFFAAGVCVIAAFIELPEHLIHAAIWIIAAAALWLTGEVITAPVVGRDER